MTFKPDLGRVGCQSAVFSLTREFAVITQIFRIALTSSSTDVLMQRPWTKSESVMTPSHTHTFTLLGGACPPCEIVNKDSGSKTLWVSMENTKWHVILFSECDRVFINWDVGYFWIKERSAFLRFRSQADTTAL